ncbi:hypothetical protein R3P38DRAFT_3351585 [Favolaschia claudopus]|uniref:Uncharacterized protein n=1 Tax=Favolaschia claudopus TaxID=2862362 RepID=A0AAW0C3L1_9AGAR
MSRDRVGCLFIFISLRLSIAPFKLVLFETTGDPRGKAAGGTIPRFGASEAQIPRVKRPHNDSPPTSQLHFAAHGASAQSAVQLDSDYSAAVVAHQFFPTPVLFGLAIFYDLSPLHLYKRSLGQGSFDYEVPSFEALQLLAARDFLYASGLNVDPDRVRVLVTRPRGHRTDAIAAVMGVPIAGAWSSHCEGPEDAEHTSASAGDLEGYGFRGMCTVSGGSMSCRMRLRVGVARVV